MKIRAINAIIAANRPVSLQEFPLENTAWTPGSIQRASESGRSPNFLFQVFLPDLLEILSHNGYAVP